jgi:iron complex outermembrane receptor protein
MKRFSKITVGLAIANGLMATPTFAQSGERLALEEVIVTAQKRDENLTEVPIAITHFGAENIAQTGVRQLKEVAEFVPNLTISSGTDFGSRVAIRGVGANSRNIGFDTRVGVYLDGVYLGQSPALNQELLDLERIEVLRGPQGTLFGKNTVAGAINLVSKKPGDELSGTVGVELGNWDARQYSAAINVPLSDKLRSKFSFSKQTRDGWVKNLVTGNDVNEQDALAYRAQFLFLATDNFSVNLAIDGMETERKSYTGDAQTTTFGNALDSEAPNDNEVSMTIDPYEEREINGVALTMDWDLASDFAVRSITAMRDTKIQYRNDSDYAAWDLVTIDYADEYKQYSQELQLISPDDGALKYVAGIYLYQQEGDSLRRVNSSAFGDALFGTDRTRPTTTKGTVDTDSYALFVNGSYQLNEQWKLGLGFRWSEETKDVDWLVDGTGSGLFRIATGTVQDERTDRHFSPTINLNYAFGEDMNVYVKYSSGYKSGGYNLDFVNANSLEAGIAFDKETVDSFEIGLKGTALDRRLSFSLAAFRSDYEDYQVNQFIDLGGGRTSISIRNAAEVETQGLEAEATFLATENLRIMASLGLLDGEFASYPGGGTGGSDVSGNTLPFVSDVTANLGVQYFVPVEALNAELLFRVDYSYRDDFYTGADNERSRTLASGDTVQYGWVDSYSLINARIALEAADGWSIALWGRNLADEDYLTRTDRDFFGTLRHIAGVPRTYGIEASYSF